MLTKDQEEILNNLIKEYINLGKPISSEFLVKKYNLNCCSATVRNELKDLTKMGFLLKPYFSAGRIPTDKGYRFFVNKILKGKIKEIGIENWFDKDEDYFSCIRKISTKLALLSKTLVISFLKDENLTFKEGWEEIFKMPEFEEKKALIKFIKFIRAIERTITNFIFDFKIRIYIGKENPFCKIDDFSSIFSLCHLQKKKSFIIGLVGPKRMEYEKSISLLESLTKYLEKNYA